MLPFCFGLIHLITLYYTFLHFTYYTLFHGFLQTTLSIDLLLQFIIIIIGLPAMGCSEWNRKDTSWA